GTRTDVEDLVLAFDEEMMMVRRVGVEICLRALDGEDAQQAGLGELMQRVVDSREGNGDAGGDCFLVKLLGGKMPIPFREKKLGKRHALACRAQARVPDALVYGELVAMDIFLHQPSQPVVKTPLRASF